MPCWIRIDFRIISKPWWRRFPAIQKRERRHAPRPARYSVPILKNSLGVPRAA
jgi:hypothetical protein